MKKTNADSFTSKAVQHGLERTNTGRLQSLWIEIWFYCNLACTYCYANGGEKRDPAEMMDYADYSNILNQAASMGVDSIGIPGCGEPFFGKNFDLTMWLLNECAARNIYVTLFTTGEFITPELASTLFGLPVELMLKGNSLDPKRQDEFVSGADNRVIHGYGVARNTAIETLMDASFNNPLEAAKHGRTSRMALVTSIMTDETEGGLSNLNEVADIYRFCRDRNIIADIDTILKRGRALECGLSAGDTRIMEVLSELRRIAVEEYGDSEAALSSTYVETVCDRFHHHLYIDILGRIRPCIGSMDVNLGNIRNTTLARAWESEERRIIRERKYTGPCASCQNFLEQKCHSCLGRRTPQHEYAADGDTILVFDELALNNDSLLRDGCVHTTGCPLRRPAE